MTSVTKSYCRSWHDAPEANTEGTSVGSFRRQHPQAILQAYFMPSSGLRELAGQIDQQNEKYVSKKYRKKNQQSKEQLQYWRVCEGV